MSELFNIPVSESPRLRWMKRYTVTTHDNGEGGCDELGDYDRWRAFARDGGEDFIAEGNTEDEAVAALARRMCVRLWNEQDL